MVQRKFKIINKIPCALVLEANGKVVEQIREFSSSKKYIAELTKLCDGDDDEDLDAFDSDVPIDDEQAVKNETPKNKNKNWLPGPDDNWFVDYDLALAEAKKSGRPIARPTVPGFTTIGRSERHRHPSPPPLISYNPQLHMKKLKTTT